MHAPRTASRRVHEELDTHHKMPRQHKQGADFSGVTRGYGSAVDGSDCAGEVRENHSR